MRNLALAALLLAACASAPRDETPDHERAVYENVTVEQARQAAVEAVGEITEEVRVTDDGRVVGEGDWRTVEVRFVERDAAVEVAVDVDTEDPTCRPSREPAYRPPVESEYGAAFVALEDGQFQYVRASVASGRLSRVRWERHLASANDCDRRSRRGTATERRILDEIRAVLEVEGAAAGLSG